MVLPVATAVDKELEMRGVFRYANAHPLAIGLISTRRVLTAPLVSDRFSLDQTQQALEQVARRAVVKAVIDVNGGSGRRA